MGSKYKKLKPKHKNTKYKNSQRQKSELKPSDGNNEMKDTARSAQSETSDIAGRSKTNLCVDRPQSQFYFVPQETHSQAGLATGGPKMGFLGGA